MPDVFVHDAYVSSAGRWAFVLFAFAFGGTLGSFMNVVVYRLPRRMSLSWPGSHCPHCGRPIRWHDNVPILGWLWLKGHCRDCRAPISPRYPLVEALVAATSAILAWVDLFVPLADGPGDAFGLSLAPYAFHLLLMCTLLTAALIEHDGHRPPARMLTLAMAVGLAAGGMWPQLRWDAALVETHLGGIVAGALGGLAAMLLSALAWPAWVDDASESRIWAAANAAAELALVGVFLGTREMACAAAIAMPLLAKSRLLARAWPAAARFGWSCCLSTATLSTIVALRSWLWLESRMIEYDAATTLVAAGMVVAAAAIVSRWAASPNGA